eukprot:TRINITY_DN3389_c0_g1_i3.p1 TRINITY_DN3389_c0_g1~~TRINITY_DN3389_c0_g1_i3.p1  ORF type:complete len:227 (-),score=57.95 TRINITY_DN3389_c0_g1_i3:916-1596(-)
MSSQVEAFTLDQEEDVDQKESVESNLDAIRAIKDVPLGQLSTKTSDAITFLLFGKITRTFNEEWRQGFFFNAPDRDILQYGLVQLKGGPCGVLASVQGYIVKDLFYGSDVVEDQRLTPSIERRKEALVNAITEILWQSSPNHQCKLVLPKAPMIGKFTPTNLVVEGPFTDTKSLKDRLTQRVDDLMEQQGNGILYFLYSLIATRTIPRIRADMDDENGKLIGLHNY